MARAEVIKTALGQRLRDVRRAVGDRPRDVFAKDIGLSSKTIANYERGDTQPDASAISAYRERFNVDANWLVTGDGEMFGRISLTKELDNAIARSVAVDLRRIGEPESGQTSQDRPGFVHLPVYSEVRASAGPGAAAVSELADGVMSFDHAFLRSTGANPGKCVVIWATGDSMMPTIPDGSALVVDRSQDTISNGFISVIGVGEDLLVKRIRRRLDGLIELISDNPAYAPETLGPDALAQLRVVGRVVYFCRVP
jgi:phage repressor protein C with HTH and peptisase S24 domain